VDEKGMGEIVSDVLPPEEEEMARSRFKPVWFVYIALALFLVIVLAFIIFRPILVLPRITLAPGFALIDQDGNRLTNEDMRGKIVLYNITHTTCEPPCGQTSQTMKEVQGRLGEIDSGIYPIEFVTISLDPERDTPEVLRTYAESLGADLDQWHFLTGPVDRLKMVVGGGFNLYFDHKEDGRLVYDPALMLVDGVGILRAEYITGDPGADRVLSDIEYLLDEIENSDGANKLAYEAAHLFMCYP
jgi:protein SCO1